MAVGCAVVVAPASIPPSLSSFHSKETTISGCACQAGPALYPEASARLSLPGPAGRVVSRPARTTPLVEGSRDRIGLRTQRRRAVHASAYDKNVEDQVRPAVVPDDVIGGAGNSDKYWGPHPKTGVFGPAAVDAKLAAAGPDPGVNAGGGSVLDQKVWYRPLEDVEKPPPVA